MTHARNTVRRWLAGLLEADLPRNHRLLLMLYCDERDLSMAEIAEVLGVAEDDLAESLTQFVRLVRTGGAA